MILLPAPHRLNGDVLTVRLAEAGVPTRVSLLGDELELADLREADRIAAETVVAAHADEATRLWEAEAAAVANAATIRDRATQALSTNADFLALASPNNAQNAAQVKALTRQVNGLVRLVLGRLDGTD